MAGYPALHNFMFLTHCMLTGDALDLKEVTKYLFYYHPSNLMQTLTAKRLLSKVGGGESTPTVLRLSDTPST